MDLIKHLLHGKVLQQSYTFCL